MSEIVSVVKDIALFRDQKPIIQSTRVVAANVFDKPETRRAAVSTGEVQELQDVLESLVVRDRLRKALFFLKKELIVFGCSANCESVEGRGFEDREDAAEFIFDETVQSDQGLGNGERREV